MVQQFRMIVGEQGQAISATILALPFCGAVLLGLV
jgi:hypothetical protein